jgi:hypothetical protein
MPNPRIWNKSAPNSGAPEPIGLFDWWSERFVKVSQFKNLAISG